jgi:hypothetical protein
MIMITQNKTEAKRLISAMATHNNTDLKTKQKINPFRSCMRLNYNNNLPIWYIDAYMKDYLL